MWAGGREVWEEMGDDEGEILREVEVDLGECNGEYMWAGGGVWEEVGDGEGEILREVRIDIGVVLVQRNGE